MGCVLGLVLVTVSVNIVGIKLVGDVQSWNRWLGDHSRIFLAWRVLLYVLAALGWLWLRQRVRSREPTRETRARFIRMEIAAVSTLLILECTVFLRHP